MPLSPLENAAIALRVHVQEAVYWFDNGEPERARRMLTRGMAAFERAANGADAIDRVAAE